MKIDCYLSDRCGSYHQLRENIDRALAGSGLKAEVEYHTIQSNYPVCPKPLLSYAARIAWD
jgi:hypothetical protein